MYLIFYAVTGDTFYAVMGGTVVTTCGSSMVLFYFVSLDQRFDESRERNWKRSVKQNIPLIFCGLWLITGEVSGAIANFVTNPNGELFDGLSWLCMNFWLNPVVLFFMHRLRGILCRLSPSDISDFLVWDVLAIGFSSLAPMVYVSLETLKCVVKVEEVRLYKERSDSKRNMPKSNLPQSNMPQINMPQINITNNLLNARCRVFTCIMSAPGCSFPNTLSASSSR